MTAAIQGVLPIAHTPFLENDRIDYDSLQRQVEWARQQGADGYCTGMVSELLRLTVDERLELTAALAGWKGDDVFVAGVGAESTPQAVHFARHAEQAGCSAVMAIPPISSALARDQLLAYFQAIADSIAVPLIIQDASSYVGQTIPLDVCVELLDRYGPQRILFKPEASPIGPNLSALRDTTSGRARIFEGSGGISLVDSYRRGIAGTMPGMEMLPAIVALWQALQAGDEQWTYRLYFPVCAVVALQLQAGLDGFLAVEKYIMHRRGLFQTERRRQPYGWQLDDETRRELDRLLTQLEDVVLEWGRTKDEEQMTNDD